MTRPDWLAKDGEEVRNAPWAAPSARTPGWYAKTVEEPRLPAFLADLATGEGASRNRPPSLPPPAAGTGPRPSARPIRPTFPPPEGLASAPPPAFETPPPADSQAEAAYLEARDEFAAAVSQLATAKADLLATMEERLWLLAIDVAEAIVDDQVERHPELERSFARVALDSLDSQGVAKLRVSRRSWDALVDVFGGAKLDLEGRRAELVLDPSLEGLGCVAECGDSRVDGRLKERFDAVRRAYQEGLLTESEAKSSPPRSAPLITNSIPPSPTGPGDSDAPMESTEEWDSAESGSAASGSAASHSAASDSAASRSSGSLAGESARTGESAQTGASSTAGAQRAGLDASTESAHERESPPDPNRPRDRETSLQQAGRDAPIPDEGPSMSRANPHDPRAASEAVHTLDALRARDSLKPAEPLLANEAMNAYAASEAPAAPAHAHTEPAGPSDSDEEKA